MARTHKIHEKKIAKIRSVGAKAKIDHIGETAKVGHISERDVERLAG